MKQERKESGRRYKDFEDFLNDKFSESEGGYILDDDWPEAFNDWLEKADPNDLIKWADDYASHASNKRLTEEATELLERVTIELQRRLISGGMETNVAESLGLDELLIDIEKFIDKEAGQ